MTSRGLNEYMSTVNAFGTNTQTAQNYAKNYRKRGEDAYNNKLADWRSQAEQKTASILEAAQEKYQGQLAKGKEVIESSMGAYGAAKGAKAAFNTFQRVKAAGVEREAGAKSLFADESPVDTPTASTLFGGSEEAPKPTETETSMADSEVSDITSSTSDVPATDGFGLGSSQTGSSGFLPGDTPGSSQPVEGAEEAGEVAEGAGEAEEATTATSAFESAQSMVSGASDAISSGIADATASATSLGEGLLGEAAATIGGDAVVGEALIAAGPEAILAAGAVAGVAYGISDLMKHINHKDTPSAEDIAKKLPAKPDHVDFVANSVNQAKSAFISGAFDSVNDVAGSVAAF